MKNEGKLLIFLLITALFHTQFVYSVGFSSSDTFTSDSSSSSDAKTFKNRDLAFTIDSTSIMVACFDFHKTCGGTTEYTHCYSANQQDYDDCNEFDSFLSGFTPIFDATP